MATWSNKLEGRLSALADSASKESIQTLAKWIGFNRKHMAAFCDVLNAHLDDNTTREWLYWQIIHQVLMLERDTPTKWERLSDARITLGERVVVPSLQEGSSTLKQKVAPLVKEWEEYNVFGTPTLVHQIKRILVEENKEEVAPEAAVTEAKTEAPSIEEPAKSKVEAKTDEKPKQEKSTEAAWKPSGSSEEVMFDFDASGIAFKKVEAREFLEPCKAIATLQIARDLRNDAAVQLSSQLSALPQEIKDYCQHPTTELSEDQAKQFAAIMDEHVLDTDLEEALVNAKTFMSIVGQQHQARNQLIHLLIQCKCQFGSEDAARTFYSLDGILQDLKERKQLLSDAMDLEGLDYEASSCEAKGGEVALEPLTWYKPDDEPNAKRARIE